jgi:hypothetical protein
MKLSLSLPVLFLALKANQFIATFVVATIQEQQYATIIEDVI